MRRRVVLLALVGILCLVGMVASPPVSAVVYCDDLQGQYCESGNPSTSTIACNWRGYSGTYICVCGETWDCLQPPG